MTVCINYHLSEILAEIIECKNIAAYELSITPFTQWYETVLSQAP